MIEAKLAELRIELPAPAAPVATQTVSQPPAQSPAWKPGGDVAKRALDIARAASAKASKRSARTLPRRRPASISSGRRAFRRCCPL